MDWRDLHWVGPAGAVLAWGLVYLWAVRRRAPRAVGLALVAVVLALAVFALEALFFVPAMERFVLPRGGLLGLGYNNTWLLGRFGFNVLKAGLAGLLLYAVALDRRPAGE